MQLLKYFCSVEKQSNQFQTLPLVSIVMATYNRSDLLEKTILNIFQQTYTPIELIVVDDGSTDNTQDILKKLQTKFPTKVILNKPNLGLQKSLNRGIQNAKGKYIARIDDHDHWTDPMKLEKQVHFLETQIDYGLVGTAYHINENIFTNPLSDQDIRHQILMRCPFCHVSVLIRKSILDQVGIYDENLSYSEDWDMWLKIGKITKFANLPDVTTEVIIPDSKPSLSNTYFLKQLPINRALVKKYQSFYPNSLKGNFYHTFLHYFFTIFTIDSWPHRLMQHGFRYFFLKNK